MESKLNIDVNEVLRYLGYGSQKIDESIRRKINESIEEARAVSKVKYVYRRFNLIKKEEGILLEETKLLLRSSDIRELLKGSRFCVLMAVTIGYDIEKLINLYKNVDMARSIILDACATAAVEEACNDVQKEIGMKILKGDENFTFRFSPGYGDLSLSVQDDLIKILDCNRKIGVSVSENMILFPRKSITAIVGVRNSGEIALKCDNCSICDICRYKKGEVSGGC